MNKMANDGVGRTYIFCIVKINRIKSTLFLNDKASSKKRRLGPNCYVTQYGIYSDPL